jgi:hypothetical protein
MSFDMRFIDESHNGGTTELAKKTLEYYGGFNTFTIQITATYSKPINDYNIPRKCWILWNLEDINLCKGIKNKNNIKKLIERHGEIFSRKILPGYSIDNIFREYSKYPELWILTDEIKSDIKSKILENTINNDYGWSIESCFLLKQSKSKSGHVLLMEEFQNESETLKLWYRIFGKRDITGIPVSTEYSDNIVFMKRVEKICKNSSINSRFMGEGEFRSEPMIILAF